MIVFHLMNKNLLLPRSRLGVLWIHNAFTHTTLKQFKIITVSIEKVAGQLRFKKIYLSFPLAKIKIRFGITFPLIMLIEILRSKRKFNLVVYFVVPEYNINNKSFILIRL